MIASIIDSDLYKFTTSYAYMKLFPHAVGTFTFIDRNKTVYTKEMVEIISQRISAMSKLYLHDVEKEFMIQKCKFLPPVYFEWLQGFRFNYSDVNIQHLEDGQLSIEVTGPLYRITLWEVPILAIVSQVLSEEQGMIDISLTGNIVTEKLKKLIDTDVRFSEFGTRRRASLYCQDKVLEIICKYAHTRLTGTSNCHFARKYNLSPMGTHPHEWFMFHGAMYGYEHANFMALENWINVYDGDLGIALTDTYTTDVFFRNFSKKQAKLFDGVRHDSGDPFTFTNKVINRYKELNIDPTSKTIIFSDGLDFDKAAEISNYCKTRIKCAFGIGTYLTNDVGLKPANIVMKLTSCQMSPKQPLRQCIKLSDVEGKHTGFPEEITLAKSILGL